MGKEVFVLYTGGTIGMKGHPLQPMNAEEFQELLHSMPGFTEEELTLQTQENEDYQVRYHFESIEPPIDSASMTPDDWLNIAITIIENYEGYNGFVILHGTDTMAWTSSALSYLLDGLSKPVIVTGSQIPLSKMRNDALRNLTTSIELAANYQLPEVGLFFNTQLMRGNRAVKVNASGFDGFQSPEYPPLAVAGIEIEIMKGELLPMPTARKSLELSGNRKKLHQKLILWKEELNKFSVIALNLFPGMPSSMLKAILNHTTPVIKGIVLEAFGEGDAPSTNDFLKPLQDAVNDGVVIIDNTQCLMGSVNIHAYESASGLRGAGVISGNDLTPEAALTKLYFLLLQGFSTENIKEQMQVDINGDLTMYHLNYLS